MGEITWQQPKFVHTVKVTYILVNSTGDGKYKSKPKIRREYTPLLQIRLHFPQAHDTIPGKVGKTEIPDLITFTLIGRGVIKDGTETYCTAQSIEMW